MSANADRYACPQCSEIHERVCARVAADRIAALEVELAEARNELAQWNSMECKHKVDLAAERAAHERTKAELAESEKEGEHALRQLDKALTDLEEAKRDVERLSGDRDRYRRDCVLAENLANGLRQDMAVIVADRDAAIAREQAAQAEAAAMRSAIASLISNPHCATTLADGCHAAGFCRTCADQYAAGQDALNGTAGRALAARVPLWRELEELSANVNTNCDWIVKSGHMNDEHDPECTSCQIDAVLLKLAALDEKGGD